jgi:glycerol-3-phosphate dehydrogenase (NAD(P)+)
MKKISIIGAGSWGMALSIYLANMGHSVKVWSFSASEADMINRDRKCVFLKDAVIPDNVMASTDFKEVLDDTEITLIVTPSKFVRETVKKFKELITTQKIIICSKGFEASTLKTLVEVVEEELPNNIVGVLSGPSHAEEVSVGVPTALVIASKDRELRDTIQEEFTCEKMRIYTSDDVLGVELGGALKNIIAFCAGIITAIELGDNSYAALITRGLAEITRLGIKMGANRKTFYGLTGLGDLIVTCGSLHSRNRKAGFLLGQGKKLDEIRKEVGMTIESIDNIEVAYALSKKYNANMPIVDTSYKVLYENLKPSDAVKYLMTRSVKEE